MRAESPRQKHHIAAPHTYLSNAMKRAVGALERTGGFTIPGAVPQADIKRAFGPKLTASHTISLSPTFNHTRRPARTDSPLAYFPRMQYQVQSILAVYERVSAK